MMVKYRGASLIRAGFIGVSVAVLVVLVGLAPQRLTSWATQVRYQAVFPEAGGLVTGNDVLVSGIKVGTVSDVSLLRGGDALVTFTVDGTVHLGSQTTAHIKTGTVLGGARIVTLVPAGAGTQKPADPIPLSRTSSPYVLTDAVGDLTANAAGDRHRIVEPVSADLVGHGRCDGAATGTHLGWADPAAAIDEQS